MVQFQLFGRGNTQIIRQEIGQSLSAILVNVADSLKNRAFTSDEVRDHLFSRIDEITQFLNDNNQSTLDTSKYMIFPFKAIAIQESLQDQGYVRSMLDTLSVIAFTEPEFEVLANPINIKIAGKNIFGIYYTAGQLNLVDSYTRLLKCMVDKKVSLPGGFVCIPLDTSGEYALEEKKINNIVTNIVGDSAYIRPLRMGTPKCLSLSSYIISEAQNLAEAQAHIQGVLGLE
jgi:hypothetical protein